MAWFHFCTANIHPFGRSTLSDMADWFKSGLLDLGHTVTFSDRAVETRAINIFWECFRPGHGEEITKTGIAYGIAATEIPDGHAFNWRKEPEWKARFDSFPAVANGASFIWTMIESTLPYYSQFCPAAYMELDFSERLIPHYICDQPQHDFCFFGLRTPYRERVVEKLRNHAKVEWPTTFLASDEVGRLIGNSKVGLSFKQSENWPIPSPTRLARLMMAKRGVAAEFVPVPTRQGEIVGLCPESSDYSEYALHVLNSGWRRRAEEAYDAYRAKMPMSDIVQHVLDHTLVGIGSAKPRFNVTAGDRDARRQNAQILSSTLYKLRTIHTWLRRKLKRLSTGGRIDIVEQIGEPPHLVDSIDTWNIVWFREIAYAVPRSAGPLDLSDKKARALVFKAGGASFSSVEEARSFALRMSHRSS